MNNINDIKKSIIHLWKPNLFIYKISFYYYQFSTATLFSGQVVQTVVNNPSCFFFIPTTLYSEVNVAWEIEYLPQTCQIKTVACQISLNN